MCHKDKAPIFIYEEACEALGRKWHVSCFVCSQCGKPLKDSGYLEHEGKAFCETDYQNLVGERCAACSQVITAQYLEALGKKFHPNCFSCFLCKKLLQGVEFLVDGSDAVCSDCYHNKNSPKCGGCGNPIFSTAGKEVFCIKAFDQKWHKECFHCLVSMNCNVFFSIPYEFVFIFLFVCVHILGLPDAFFE
eukprot:Sdes_comp20677_c0_seq1m16111